MGYYFKLCDFKSLLTFWDFKTHMFSCYLCSMVYVSFFCVICSVFFGLGFFYCCTLVIFWSWSIRYHSKYFYIMLYVCWQQWTICKHWHKSTWYITFFLTKWCKKVKRRLFFCRFWKNFTKFDYTSKKSSPYVNRFPVLSQVFLPDFLLFSWMLDTFWDDGH